MMIVIYIFFGWSNKPSEMLSDVHLGSNKLMLAIYKHNSVVFDATVFYPYLCQNSVTDTWEYDKHAFMRFISQHKIIMINHRGEWILFFNSNSCKISF